MHKKLPLHYETVAICLERSWKGIKRSPQSNPRITPFHTLSPVSASFSLSNISFDTSFQLHFSMSTTESTAATYSMPVNGFPQPSPMTGSSGECSPSSSPKLDCGKTSANPLKAPATSKLQIQNNDIMTPDAVASLYKMYARDLVEFKMIDADGVPSRRYQWLFEKMIGRSQRLYSMREMQTATIAAKALDDLEKLIMGRKKMEVEYSNELKEKDVMIKTLMNQLQEALEEQNHLLNKLDEFRTEKDMAEGA
ncbi:hypothetical protein BZA77DRAFT_321019 [Pyronema omphalodes]|nr:hypothetical protein BZA77DRAFT_321019 [Pyronema omphalodes]